MSALVPKPPDDATDKLLTQRVALHRPYTCSACNQPLVVCEKQLLNEMASRRLWCLCPQCGYGFEVLALHVVEGVAVPIEAGACLFDSEPHRRSHRISWQCKHAPRWKKPKKLVGKAKKKRGKR